MSNLGDMLKEVESEFENEQKRNAEAAANRQEDQAVLKRVTEEQWKVLHSELEAKANSTGNPNIHHESGMIQIGGECRIDLRITREEYGTEKLKAIFSSVCRNIAKEEAVLIPAIVKGHFQWSTEGFESDGKPCADLAESLLKKLKAYYGLVLRAPQR
jgi:hypothetical protein